MPAATPLRRERSRGTFLRSCAIISDPTPSIAFINRWPNLRDTRARFKLQSATFLNSMYCVVRRRREFSWWEPFLTRLFPFCAGRMRSCLEMGNRICWRVSRGRWIFPVRRCTCAVFFEPCVGTARNDVSSATDFDIESKEEDVSHGDWAAFLEAEKAEKDPPRRSRGKSGRADKVKPPPALPTGRSRRAARETGGRGPQRPAPPSRPRARTRTTPLACPKTHR